MAEMGVKNLRHIIAGQDIRIFFYSFHRGIGVSLSLHMATINNPPTGYKKFFGEGLTYHDVSLMPLIVMYYPAM